MAVTAERKHLGCARLMLKMKGYTYMTFDAVLSCDFVKSQHTMFTHNKMND